MDNPKKFKSVKGEFQKIIKVIESISNDVGSPVTSDDEATSRCDNIQYLDTLKSLGEAVVQKLENLLEKERKEVEFFVEQKEQKLASVRNMLRGGDHIPIKPIIAENLGTIGEHLDNKSGVVEKPSSKRNMQITNASETIAESDNIDTGTASDADAQSETGYLWAVVGRKGRTSRVENHDIIPPAASEGNYKVISVQVGKDTGFVRAVEVNTVKDCVRFPGRLCWAKNKKIICYSFEGVPRPLVSKIPRIYSLTEIPQKFYDHKYLKKGETVNPDDHSYHVPIEHAEFADHWCFTDKARYLPASSTPSRSDTYVYRIGDYDNFADDLSHISEDSPEYLLFRNIASGYWITLCAIEDEFKGRRQSGRK
jgi:hypothetical protein